MSILIETYCAGDIKCESLASATPAYCSRIVVFMSADSQLIHHTSINLNKIRTGKSKYQRKHDCDHEKSYGVVKLGTLRGTSTVANPTGVKPIGETTTGVNRIQVFRSSSHPCNEWGEVMLFPGQEGFCYGDIYVRNKYDKTRNTVIGSTVVAHPLTGQRVYVYFNLRVDSERPGTLFGALYCSCKFTVAGVWKTFTVFSNPFLPEGVGLTTTSLLGTVAGSTMIASVMTFLHGTTTDYRGNDNFSTVVQLKGGSIPYSKDAVKQSLTAQINRARSSGPTNVQWGDLCQTAINGFRHVDINTCVWLKELFSIKSTMVQTISLLKGDISPKSVSKLFLSDKYGLSLTVNDTVELAQKAKERIENIGKVPFIQKSSAQVFLPLESGNRRVNYMILASDPENKLLSTLKKGLDWDVLPTLQNLWDVIPFSFVVDWFVDVEGFCQTIDTSIYEQYLDIHSVIYTFKDTFNVELSPPFDGTLECVSYHRHLAAKAHAYFPNFDRSDRWKDNINVLTALILVKS